MAYTKDIEPTIQPGSLKAKVENGRKSNEPKEDKYEQALHKYNCDVDEAEVKAAVEKIIAEKVPENDNEKVKKFLLGSVELTSLHTTDTDESILAMTEKVNKFDEAYPDLPHVATICVYPNFAHIVSQSLEVDGVEVAVVSGSFPSSQTFIEVKVAETALAIKDGATNVDIVLPVGKFLSGDYEGLADDIDELKQTCGEVPMKVILETCDLGSLSNVKKAVPTTSRRPPERRSRVPHRKAFTSWLRRSRSTTSRQAASSD